MRGKIFISYRRDDSASLALGIYQFLERQFGRNNVFIDVDMQAGAKFPDLLERRLGECKILLALIGPRWLDARDDAGNRRLDDPNDWVRLEIARALKRGITVRFASRAQTFLKSRPHRRTFSACSIIRRPS